jgi:hypothetical protein
MTGNHHNDDDDDDRDAIEVVADRLNPDHAAQRRREQTARRQRLNAGMVEIPGLQPVGDTMLVWPVDDWRLAQGWTVVSADIGLKSGSPLGSITYVRHTDPTRSVVVSVRWDYFHAQLQCLAQNSDLTEDERVALELDARHRVATLMFAAADIGTRTARSGEAQAPPSMLPPTSRTPPIRPRDPLSEAIPGTSRSALSDGL